MKVDIDSLRKVLNYDPETGDFTWKLARSNRVKVGAKAGCMAAVNGGAQQHWVIRVDGMLWRAHRLAWVITFGRQPDGEIDHLDCNPLNNKLSNLRDVPHYGNMQNRRRANSRSSTGVLGVSKGDHGKWVARLQLAGKRIHIGRFKTIEEAHAAYVAAKRRLHEFNTL